jgi:hypothetical protein
MTLHYQGSKGPVAIASMPYPHLRNALEKLQREGAPDRQAEIAAMSARLAHLDAEEPKAAAPEENPRVVMGDNNPPVETPRVVTSPAQPADAYGAHAAHIDDLYTEAKNWADGADIENDDQAAEVDRLIADFKDAIAAAEASRDAEKKPHADKVKEIQERYYPLVGETKAITGTAIRAKSALLAVKTRWANKVAAAQRIEAERLRQEAIAKAHEAATVAREAVGNIEATESAEDLIRDAQATLRAANQAEKPTVKGMRDNWVVKGFAPYTDAAGETMSGERALLRHYIATRPEDLLAACLEMARKDVRDGRRAIPGVLIENERRAV